MIIQAENILFNGLSLILRTEIPEIYVTGEVVSQPPSFPCVTFIEMSNTTYKRSLTAELEEHHANVMYEVNVYSNLVTGKKSQCREIMAVIDNYMLGWFFTRIFMEPMPNLLNDSIYRIVTRYTAVIGADGAIYRR